MCHVIVDVAVLAEYLYRAMELTPETDHLLTAAEVAEIFRCSPRSVHRLGESGVLTPVRIGPHLRRYRCEEVERLARGEAVTPSS